MIEVNRFQTLVKNDFSTDCAENNICHEISDFCQQFVQKLFF